MEMPPLITGSCRAKEALSRVRVLYTDLDGTLVARGGNLLADGAGEPSTVTVEAIVALNRDGREVVPISGRGRVQLIEFVRAVGWSDFIAEAGSVLVHGVGPNQRIIYNNAEWPAKLLADGSTPFELIEQSGALPALAQAFPGRIEYHDPWHLGREATHVLRGALDTKAAQEVLDRLDLPVGLLDNGVVNNRGTLTLATDERPHAYHLVPKGVSKAQAIRLDLETRGLRPDQAAAIGDSVTDIQMADSVGLMALVDNAFEGAGVRDALAKNPRGNVWRTEGKRGEGWSQFAHAWLEAR